MTAQDQVLQKTTLGVYTHVPFCASTCDFCAFYQKQPNREEIKRYLQGIQTESDLFLKNIPVDTIFWGGGTPGLLMPKDLDALGQSILKNITNRPTEWTIEMAPSTVKPEKLKVLKDLGVTRISMGVQSFNAKTLEGLGRLHSPKQVYKAWDYIQEAGFQNTNLDLIFAIPGQSITEWLTDLNEAIRLSPAHISTYCLTFEEDTKLYVKLSQGKIKRDIDQEANLYERTWEVLENNGYHQYEISNFAKPGQECQHNVHTWQMHEWIGLGPSASSQYQNKRFTNPASIEEWLKGIETGNQAYIDTETLTENTLALDSLIFGLRMNTGVNLPVLQQRFPHFNWQQLDHIIQTLTESEHCNLTQESILKLTSTGRLMADSIAKYLMEEIE
ncbi:MAG: coproporphyrinogen III oxidase [Verrucomicrobia bacterium CG_4_10_14_3_um_filter_43_23]|nr:MAG: coproporphyrinogen III oxidase [Verrucomicrobia bacterium CG22_combo_CG10-13_8_21_14_all_43_17]PIX58424.1 MAG: coproporphyrinogen III oxidase [Verrucomicrobia bacterium CG_4_10_14_3_um_filter_43_23]PIY61571.1 MAG: coproporphyrinogen III oxidase [Verrucomicrobia bacterium CG_4_10_14_0_8_um_filter_43_34]PJA43648.1 MAG: coproporphyrinogen III oxidase [Verrucomicrobia bacterium CG_4_9_14_3_um_filter_43_20]